MPHPTIPILVGSFEDSTSYKANPIINQFKPGTTIERGSPGLNSVMHTRRIQYPIEGYVNVKTLLDFLKERGSKPFYYTPFLDRTTDNTIYICKSYSFKRMSDNVYIFNGEFEQVFRLKR